MGKIIEPHPGPSNDLWQKFTLDSVAYVQPIGHLSPAVTLKLATFLSTFLVHTPTHVGIKSPAEAVGEILGIKVAVVGVGQIVDSEIVFVVVDLMVVVDIKVIVVVGVILVVEETSSIL